MSFTAALNWLLVSGGHLSYRQICDVLDWYVKDRENGFRIMKHLMARNWHRWPTLKYIRFFREI